MVTVSVLNPCLRSVQCICPAGLGPDFQSYLKYIFRVCRNHIFSDDNTSATVSFLSGAPLLAIEVIP